MTYDVIVYDKKNECFCDLWSLKEIPSTSFYPIELIDKKYRSKFTIHDDVQFRYILCYLFEINNLKVYEPFLSYHVMVHAMDFGLYMWANNEPRLQLIRMERTYLEKVERDNVPYKEERLKCLENIGG